MDGMRRPSATEDRWSQQSAFNEVKSMIATAATFKRQQCAILALGILALATAIPVHGQATGVRKQFMGMHNLKDGGPDPLTGFHWTKNLTGPT